MDIFFINFILSAIYAENNESYANAVPKSANLI